MSGSDVRVFFGGLAVDDSARRRLERATAAARRWSFVDVRGGSSAEAWWGEALPSGEASGWRPSYPTSAATGVYGDPADLGAALGGRHPAARISPATGRIELWAGDGSSPVFYAAERGALCFASDPTLLCSALSAPPELDPVGLASLFAIGHTPPGRSLFAGVRRVPPRHLVGGGPDAWGDPCSRVAESIPVPGGGPSDVAVAARALAAAVTRVDAAATWLPLTGGRDSRALLACTRPGGPVRAYTRGRSRDAEVVLAVRAARLHGVRHDSFPFRPGYVARSFPRIVHLTGGCVSAMHGHAIHPLVTLAAHGARRVVPGVNGTYGRGSWFPGAVFTGVRDERDFWQHFFKCASVFSDESLPSLFREPWREALGVALPRARAEYASGLFLSPADSRTAGGFVTADSLTGAGLDAADALDRILLLRRVPLFSAWGPYIWGSALCVTMPYLDGAYVRAVGSLPSASRAGAPVHRAVMREHDPKLLGLPLVPSWRKLEDGPGDAWRSWMRPRLASLLGISRGAPQRYGAWLRRERHFVESVLLSERCLDRAVFEPGAIREAWQRHLAGHDRAALICALVTLELACRIVAEGDRVEW